MTVASGVDARLRTARLAVRVDADEPDVAGLAGELFAGGVNLLHLDRTGADPGGELTVLRAARAAAHAHQGLLSTGPAPVLDDGFRPDVLQLDGSDGPAASVRQQAHPWARIGRSTENATELARAVDDPDVDHLWVGVELVLELELVRAAAALLPPQGSAGKPWFALGASDQKSLEDVLAAGARRVLVGRSLTASDDPRAAARRIRTRLNQAWRDDPAMAGTGLALGGTPRPLRPRGG